MSNFKMLIQTVKSEAPNHSFLANALNHCFNLSVVLLKLWKLFLRLRFKIFIYSVILGELGTVLVWPPFGTPNDIFIHQIIFGISYKLKVTIKVERKKKPFEQDNLVKRPIECSKFSNVSHSSDSFKRCSVTGYTKKIEGF